MKKAGEDKKADEEKKAAEDNDVQDATARDEILQKKRRRQMITI